MINVGLIIPKTKKVPLWFYNFVHDAKEEGLINITNIEAKQEEYYNFKPCFFYNIEKIIYKNLKKNDELVILHEKVESNEIPQLYIQIGVKNIEKKDAPYGVWHVKISNNYTENYYASLEECAKNKTTNIKVVAYMKDKNVIIENSVFYNARMYARNRNILLHKCYFILKHAIKNINNINFENIFFEENNKELKENNLFYIRTYIKAFIKEIKKIKNHKSHWSLFIGKKQKELPKNIKNTIEVKPPKDRFWADPFTIKYNNKKYIFAEELIYKEKKGNIIAIEYESNNYNRIGKVLDLPYHLSYPFIIKDKNELYMIPESNRNSTIDLYHCDEFPLKWNKVKTLISDIKASDTTIFKYNGIWWMFTSVRSDGLSQDEQLYLYYNDEDLLNGNWIKHKLSPIVLDCRYARMAGNIFEKNGKLYRPSQDCSNVYGGAINYMEIEKIDKENYVEKFVTSTIPTNHYKGVHTYNELEDEYILDSY